SAAMSQGTGLSEFAQAFTERFIDVGISEEHGVTFAGGLATEGLRPVVAIYSTFMQRSFDQIIHDIALQNLPVVSAMDRAGLVGEDGPTHHGVFDLVFMRMIPRLTVMAPKDAEEFRNMLQFALDFTEGPISIRYPRGSVPTNNMPSSPVVFGKSELLIRHKTAKVAVVAIGSMVAPAYEVIVTQNLPVKLINVRFLRPLDHAELRQELAGCEALVSIEEGIKQGGLYSALAELICEEKLAITLTGMGLENTEFYAQGTREQLLRDAGLDMHAIQRTLEKCLGGK
ncbi:MAG: transketolase C-terminal domain-containing protein, partial [Candidatus Margulisiibacteriota bacterium]